LASFNVFFRGRPQYQRTFRQLQASARATVHRLDNDIMILLELTLGVLNEQTTFIGRFFGIKPSLL
jgi:hypothetical protein